MSDTQLLLHSFTITHVMDCIADPNKNRVIAELSDDVSPVFPYLNAILKKLMYNPGANSVTIKRGVRILTFYPHVAVMAKVDGEADAVAQLRWFQELCNDAWQRRAEIVPCHKRRRLLGPLDVYRLLPKLNCKSCGEATCMAFAFGLLWEEHRLEECSPLLAPQHAAGGQRLAELL
jgi:ArsR family metal-binding transcriptional regulator